MITPDVDSNSVVPANSSAGAQWVERFLLPRIDGLLAGLDAQAARRCLQIFPDDEDEARRLREAGWECDLVVENASALSSGDWCQTPLVYSPGLAALSQRRYALLLSGYLGLWLEDSATRSQRIDELAGLCAPGGGILTAIGNRYCPLDLTGNARTLHGPGVQSLATLASLEADFVTNSSFNSVRPLTVSGHFGWNRAKGPMKAVARLLEWNWRHLATPGCRLAYTSPINPVLMVWIER